jgi:hypothetical protein
VNVSYYRQLLLPIVRDHTWVIFGGTLASAAARVRDLRELGAGRCLVIAFGSGTGSKPAAEDADWLVVEQTAVDIVDAFRQQKAADTRRSGGAWTAVNLRRPETEQFSLRRGQDGWRWSAPGEPADGRLEIGPSALGGFLRFTPDPAPRPAGSSLAPEAAQVLMLADGRFGAGLGRLQAAREVRHAGQRAPSEGRSNQSPSHT